mmetsp:Transcript_1877/g.3972  ORF Transcript_1877/g.3972 Transcript_1877/m.3972 type:complete len:209 (-) Transcript_1877:534-1160(-)
MARCLRRRTHPRLSPLRCLRSRFLSLASQALVHHVHVRWPRSGLRHEDRQWVHFGARHLRLGAILSAFTRRCLHVHGGRDPHGNADFAHKAERGTVAPRDRVLASQLDVRRLGRPRHRLVSRDKHCSCQAFSRRGFPAYAVCARGGSPGHRHDLRPGARGVGHARPEEGDRLPRRVRLALRGLGPFPRVRDGRRPRGQHRRALLGAKQ